MSTFSIYRLTRFAVILGLAFSIFSVATKANYFFSAYLFFYGFLMWFLWVICVFFSEERHSLKKIVSLWMIANISNLLLFFSFAGRVKNWAHSQGVEIIVVVSYFPVVFPTALLINFLPEELDKTFNLFFESTIREFGDGAGDALGIWLSVFIIAIIQSIGIILLSRLFTYLLRAVKSHIRSHDLQQ